MPEDNTKPAEISPAEAVSGEEPPKTAKQLEKEAKKAAKLAKLQEKLDKKAAVPVSTKAKPEKKAKEVKESAVYTTQTAPGEKKDISGALPDAYSPQYVEAAWYSWWEKQGFFSPEYGRKSLTEPNPKGKFVMVIPPPNVTGSLHLGHALTNAIEDCLARYNRMRGLTTLWVPGCDHAGIATQVVVEKRLMRDEKLSRHDLGREKFIQKVWEWKEKSGGRIYDQLKRIGSSYDWTRVAFTMDPMLCTAVTEAFVRLHENGKVYRSSRLVNWSCALRSAISDIEVDKVDIPGRTFLSIPNYDKKIEFGVLHKFAYKVEGTNDEIIVATTRIETMLGDVAVAVHPKDERYKHLHGKFVVHPFAKDRKVPILCDDFVEMEFGTGAVKITPAHDPNDYEVGMRHKLPFINIMNDDGYIIGDYGEFNGMKRFDARKRMIECLTELGLYKEVVNHPMVVPICNRSKDIIEPLIKPQWYVRCGDMAKRAEEAVRNGDLKIVPEYNTKTWYHWMNGIMDWCISRQLWWGHRIPAYQVSFTDSSISAGDDEENSWIVARSQEEALKKAADKFKVDPSKIILKQDDDVLDTWFSSGLFPFSVMGWPEKTIDLQEFFPNTLLETGHDILFFWVARMVFFGQELLGKLPFKEVYLHPMVRDAHGRKMSKSLGNVIDPMDVITGITLELLHEQLYNSNLDPKEIEKAKAGQRQDYPNGIPECGTDALRFGLCAHVTQARDCNLDIQRLLGYRFFCNKIWNATKFALLYFTGEEKFSSNIVLNGTESGMDMWMLSRLAAVADACNQAFKEYDFLQITKASYNYWMYDLCDVYLETLKPIFQNGTDDQKAAARKTLFLCLDFGLRLISPFMPFITEELWQRLPRADAVPSICVASYPENLPWRSEQIEKEVEFLQKSAKIVRSARSDYNLPNKTKTEIYIVCTDNASNDILKKYALPLSTLSYSNANFDSQPPSGCAILTVTGQCEIHLLIKGLIEADKEISKLEKKKAALEQTVSKLQQAMTANDYETKVPAEVREANSEKLSESSSEIQRIISAVETLKLM